MSHTPDYAADEALAGELRDAAEVVASILKRAVDRGLTARVTFEPIVIDVTSMDHRGPRQVETGYTANVTVNRPIGDAP